MFSNIVLSLIASTIIFQVETSGGVNLTGDNGKAIGPLQIWPIMVDECNRIVGYQKWTYSDRNDFTESINMFITYQNYYSPKINNNDMSKLEIVCRLWNGGPKLSSKTDKYWLKCQKQIQKNNYNINQKEALELI